MLRAPLFLSGSTVRLHGQPDLSVFCSPRIPCLPLVQESTIVQPFPFPVLWPLLTPHRLAVHLCTGSEVVCWYSIPPHYEASPSKIDNFPLIYLSHLQYRVRAVLDFAVPCKLVRPAIAFYALPVRQTEGLLSASFRFHLAMDTLAVQLTVPTAKSVAVSHRLVIFHVGHTRQDAVGFAYRTPLQSLTQRTEYP